MTTLTLRWEAAALTAAGLLAVGTTTGLLVQAEPITKAPWQCEVASNLATEAFAAYEEQVVAHHNRATRGRSEFDRYEAETKRLWEQIDELKDKHSAARDACLGVDR